MSARRKRGNSNLFPHLSPLFQLNTAVNVSSAKAEKKVAVESAREALVQAIGVVVVVAAIVAVVIVVASLIV